MIAKTIDNELCALYNETFADPDVLMMHSDTRKALTAEVEAMPFVRFVLSSDGERISSISDGALTHWLNIATGKEIIIRADDKLSVGTLMFMGSNDALGRSLDPPTLVAVVVGEDKL